MKKTWRIFATRYRLYRVEEFCTGYPGGGRHED